ncbi:MAG TPA: hypothetical protein VH877_20880 [Polyangia bacterium]|jgi:hypothetical protein|nr:hypothetical protein [Polyangia bacterium]
MGYRQSLWRVALCASLFVLAPLAARGEPQAAQAAGGDEAQLRFQAGSAAYEAGDFTTAIQEWKAAQLLKPAPLLDFNIALAYEQLGRVNAACKYYRRYFEQVPQAPERAEIETRLHCDGAQAAVPPLGTGAPPVGTPGVAVAPSGAAPVGAVAPPGTAPVGGAYARPPFVAAPGRPAVAGVGRGAAPRPVVVAQTKVKKSRWWIVFPVVAGAAATVGIVALVAGASSASRPRHYPDFDLTALPGGPSQTGAPLFRF